MFNLIVRYIGFLKHVPLAPHVYDALQKIQLFLINQPLLDRLDEIEETVSQWDQVSVSIHKFGGTQFNRGKDEIGHLHGNGLLDVLLTRQIKTSLMENPLILEHHIFKDSGWISFWVKTPTDRDLAITILKHAYTLRTRVH